MGTSLGAVAEIADVGMASRRVFVNGRLRRFGSLLRSLHEAEVARKVDHGCVRVAGVFEVGRRDSVGRVFALATAWGFEGECIVRSAGLGEVREGLSQSGGVDDDLLLRASRRPATVLLCRVAEFGDDGTLIVAFDLERRADSFVALGIEVDVEIIGAVVGGVVGAHCDGAMVGASAGRDGLGRHGEGQLRLRMDDEQQKCEEEEQERTIECQQH